MTSPQQKERERSILNYYLRVVSLEGEVTVQEAPDFVIVTGVRQIGIEVTEYHQPAASGHKFSRTQVEAEWERIRSAVVEYRNRHSGLENLSVLLSFKELVVPNASQHYDFIQAVHGEIDQVKSALSRRFTTIRVNERHPTVLRRYLKQIDVRIANCYIEWDWNHMVASVGTSDRELLGVLRAKLDLRRTDGIDELHLVVAGDGPTGGSYIGFLGPELLESWARTNTALSGSDYDVVAILSYEETCIWRRRRGWCLVKHE